jgi:hypothetical protein
MLELFQISCNAGKRLPVPATPPCPLCLSRLHTEPTEPLRDLCVEPFLATEDTERLVAVAAMPQGTHSGGVGRAHVNVFPTYSSILTLALMGRWPGL